MHIDGSTKILGIIGDPVAHSLSPAMQNAAIIAAGINAVYLPFHVTPPELGDVIAAIRTLGILGVNVTVPHKEAVIPFLDEIDAAAKIIGAVNTIVNRNGRLVGYNTDGIGLLRSLRETFSFQPAGKNIVLLGAGGASRAAIVALAEAGAASIVVVNRTLRSAEQLIFEFADRFPGCSLRALSLSDEGVPDCLSEAHLLVNSTAVGLHGESFDISIVEHLRADAAFCDMVYASVATPLQQEARRQGLTVMDGRGMLVGQGEEAFLLWFDLAPPDQIMRKQVLK